LREEDGKLLTPFQDKHVGDDILSGEKNLCPFRPVHEDFTGWSEYLDTFPIHNGYIHAYMYDSTAIREAKSWISHTVVYECEIPVGVEYFEGVYGDICAHELKFIRRVYDKPHDAD
jgi:hypothetical protein